MGAGAVFELYTILCDGVPLMSCGTVFRIRLVSGLAGHFSRNDGEADVLRSRPFLITMTTKLPTRLVSRVALKRLTSLTASLVVSSLDKGRCIGAGTVFNLHHTVSEWFLLMFGRRASCLRQEPG